MMSASRVVIVTGANSGVGFAAALDLAKRNYDVILACRNEERARTAKERIRKSCPEANVDYHLLDLADLSSVDGFVDWFLATGKPLYALVNNGGILGEMDRQVNKDGVEMCFAVNHLGHFLLTLRLLDKLKSSVSVYGETRIINVSSGWHSADNCNADKFTPFVVQPIDLDDLNLEKPGAYHFTQACKNSKAAILMFTLALGRSLEGTGVSANACSPGYIPSTNVFRSTPWSWRLYFYVFDNWLTRSYFNMKTVDQGAETILAMIQHDKLKGRSGLFCRGNIDECTPSDEVRDRELQNKMWQISCDLIKRPEFKDLLVP